MNQLQRWSKSNSGISSEHSYPPKHSIEDIRDKCIIGIGCLDDQLVRTVSVCEFLSLQKIKEYLARYAVLANYQLLKQRRIPQRAAMFATEILGGDDNLTEEKFLRKTGLHLLMTVQMTLQWLIDDTLDEKESIDPGVTEAISAYCISALESGPEAAIDSSLVIQQCLDHGLPEDFIAAISLLIGWQRELAVSFGISLAHSSIYSRFNRDFLTSFLQKNERFTDLPSYLEYRQVNCGLSMEILCGAYWLYWLENGNLPNLEDNAEYYIPLIYRYSLLGGVSNDLFGYDKDLEEGVATSVEVVKLTGLSGRSSNDEIRTANAFRLLIALHNDLLKELIEQVHRCTDPLLRCILLAALTTTWAIRMLHYEFRVIYRPGWLRKILGAVAVGSR